MEAEGTFESSALGTKKQYSNSKTCSMTHNFNSWDEVYSREIKNFEEHGDKGEVWFGEESVYKLVRWLPEFEGITSESPILDLGCGNGFTLTELYDEGFRNLMGVDYSAGAIDLARKIAESEGKEIEYQVDDILATQLQKKFQVVMDKGTFDAISLSEERVNNQKKYIQSVKSLLAGDCPSYFIITSCNFTTDELNAIFQQDFKYHSRIKYPTIQFGGKEGSTITTVAFIPK